MPEHDWSEYASFAEVLAHLAAAEILPHYGNSGLRVDAKDDASPVTVADRNAERVMRERIACTYPGHGIIGEEFGSEHADAEFVWVLDPIDGTKSFISGVPLFTTLIALQFQGEPVVGLIYQPVLDELMVGDGRSTRLNGELVQVRPCSDLASATLLCTDPRWPVPEAYQRGWQGLVDAVKLFRSWGDAYGYLKVAAGFADIMADPVLEHWDKAALIPVMRGAGARVTDWSGGSALSGRSFIAAGPPLHAELMDRLNTSG